MKVETILQIQLSDGRHIDVPLGWLREQLETQGLRVVHDTDAFVLDALDKAPDSALKALLDEPGWLATVAGSELGRRLAAYARARSAHNPAECEPEPKPTPHKPR